MKFADDSKWTSRLSFLLVASSFIRSDILFLLIKNIRYISISNRQEKNQKRMQLTCQMQWIAKEWSQECGATERGSETEQITYRRMNWRQRIDSGRKRSPGHKVCLIPSSWYFMHLDRQILAVSRRKRTKGSEWKTRKKMGSKCNNGTEKADQLCVSDSCVNYFRLIPSTTGRWHNVHIV